MTRHREHDSALQSEYLAAVGGAGKWEAHFPFHFSILTLRKGFRSMLIIFDCDGVLMDSESIYSAVD